MSEKENLMARNFDDIPLINANHNEFATNVFCLMGQLIKGYKKYWTKEIYYFIQEIQIVMLHQMKDFASHQQVMLV